MQHPHGLSHFDLPTTLKRRNARELARKQSRGGILTTSEKDEVKRFAERRRLHRMCGK